MLFRRTALLITCVISFLLPASANARSGHADLWIYGGTLFKFFEDGKAPIGGAQTGPENDGVWSIADENGKPLFYGSSRSARKYIEKHVRSTSERYPIYLVATSECSVFTCQRFR